jgi:hypothetical protein
MIEPSLHAGRDGSGFHSTRVCAMGAFQLGTDRSWERNRDLRLDRVERGPTSSWSREERRIEVRCSGSDVRPARRRICGPQEVTEGESSTRATLASLPTRASLVSHAGRPGRRLTRLRLEGRPGGGRASGAGDRRVRITRIYMAVYTRRGFSASVRTRPGAHSGRSSLIPRLFEATARTRDTGR